MANRLTHTLFAARAALCLLIVATPVVAGAQSGYREPPDAIARILDSPAAPVATVSPNRAWLLIRSADLTERTIAELAEPTLYLAGRRVLPHPVSRIDVEGVRSATLRPVTGGEELTIPVPEGGRITTPQWSRDGQRLAYFVITTGRMVPQVFDVATRSVVEIDAPGLAGRLAPADGWSRDGKHYLFTATTDEGRALWVAEIESRTARRLTPPVINHVAGSCEWMAGKAPVVCLLYPDGRGAPPPEPTVPAGPVVQESYGRAQPTRTNTYLLEDQHDEQLFEYHFTSQLALVSLEGQVTKLGAPAIHASPTPSPDGQFLLVRITHRPYSYQVGMQNFPQKTEVWALDGTVVRTVYQRPLLEVQPSQRDATVPGIRSISWRPDEPATLVLVEALDGGDPRRDVPRRDRVSLLRAPFGDQPQPLVETERRYGGIEWIGPTVALLSDFTRREMRRRTWVIDPSQPNGGTPRLLWDYNIEDRTAAPGSFVYTYDAASDRFVPMTTPDRRWYYLTGPGATRDTTGDRPYLDRLELATGRRERLWQSAPPYYESVVALVDPRAQSVILQRQSPTERPDYYVRDMRSRRLTRLTTLPDPAPFFSSVKAELITYQRNDGVQLSATLYLPPGYDKDRDGALPFFLWAYPREFMSEAAASQVAGSPYQFRRPSRQDHLLLLAAGYGVLDNPTMPIVGRDGREPNDTYVEQLVASAEAAIDKLVELGVGDRDRMAIGGHSYGAFMTANLLAHSDLFRAGIARSGAYNRTLTPFGFQAEPRTYWQAPEVYNAMSPFMHAHRIKEPILLIHGTHDNNQGTFPVQSERMYHALKGNGGNVRYVQLPLESHGYAARESRRHVIWEMVSWLDTHVKPPKVAQ